MAKADHRSIGILGGTFNPPHRGHLALARHAQAELGLERVLLMPANSAPHKGEQEDPGPQRRLEMCRLAVGEEAGLEVCDSGDRARRAVLYGGYLESDPCRAIRRQS